jgi:hypothetical protein
MIPIEAWFFLGANAKAVNAMGVSERAAHNDNDSTLSLEAAISHIHIRTKEHFWA